MDFVIRISIAILRLCGWSVPTPPCAPAPRLEGRTRDEAGPPQSAPPNRPPRPSRVTGPRLALRLIADMEGQVSGIRRQPDPHDLQVAWLQLGDPVAGFVQACIALGEGIPMFVMTMDEETQFARLAIQAKRSPKKFIDAMRREASIRMSREATSLLADLAERLFRGSIPAPQRTNGAAGESERHVVDSTGRPLICRLVEHSDGRLEILDAPGGFLHRDTLALSGWRVEGGWLLPAGFRNRGRNDGDGEGLPHPAPRPNPAQPKI